MKRVESNIEQAFKNQDTPVFLAPDYDDDDDDDE